MIDAQSISIVTTTFNRANKLIRLLESIEHQTQLPQQVVVVNDGSTEDYTAAKEWTTTKFILTWLDIPNSGVSVARNTGVKECSSTFVAFCDDDDYLLTNHIESLAQRVQQENGTPGIYHTYCQELRGTEISTPPIIPKPKHKTWQEHYITEGTMILSCTCMHKSTALRHPFPPGITYAEDHEQRLLALGDTPCFPIYSATVMVDRTDETATNRNIHEISGVYRARFSELFSRPNIKRFVRRKYRHQMLFRWTSLELSHAKQHTPYRFAKQLLIATGRIRSWSNIKTLVLNVVWYLEYQWRSAGGKSVF